MEDKVHYSQEEINEMIDDLWKSVSRILESLKDGEQEDEVPDRPNRPSRILYMSAYEIKETLKWVVRPFLAIFFGVVGWDLAYKLIGVAHP